MSEMNSQSASTSNDNDNTSDFSTIQGEDSQWELTQYPNSYVYSANLMPERETHIAVIALYPKHGLVNSEDLPDFRIEMYHSDSDEVVDMGTRDTPQDTLEYVQELVDLVESISSE